jgi:cytochrome c oxidase accessory protein FixG
VKVIPIVPLAAGPDPNNGENQSLYEAHKKLYPRAVTGLFARWRWAFVWLTQVVFYGLPWIEWGGRQAVLFDLAARRFYLFGYVLYPQDFIYLTGLLVVSALSLFLFTAVAGRLWCGFACPQTVYTEMFLWIERQVEGDRIKRMKLDAQPMSLEKFGRKSLKHSLWIALALWTGFTFVGFFTPIRTLWGEAFTLSFGPWEWFWVNFYGLATYGNAGFLREQVCKYMCPYARFQSAMFDKDTLIVSYDAERGEPRGSRGRKVDCKAQGLGACVDCDLCVHVCPTGIDIRKGLQYECIGCAGCIDVCNTVMDKMGYARGLIRFTTQNAVKRHWGQGEIWRHILRPRVLVYATILGALCFALAFSLAMRTPLKVDIVRDRAALSRIVEGGKLENVYRLQIMNATEKKQEYRITADGLADLQVVADHEIEVGPAESRWVAVRLRIPYGSAEPGSHPIHFHVATEHGEARVNENSAFLVPR